MPQRYAKKTSYNRNGRPGYISCGKMVLTDAQRALAMAKYLKSIVNVEFKVINNLGTADAISTTPVITQLTNVGQGDTTSTRDGANMKLVSLSLYYFIDQHATATNTQFRVMVVHDKQTNEAIYAAADLLADVTAGDAIVSHRTLDNTHRFQVFYDKVHRLNDVGFTNIPVVKFNKKLQLKLRYDGSAADITDLTSSSLSLLFVSSEATNTPTITFSCRLRFVDN